MKRQRPDEGLKQKQPPSLLDQILALSREDRNALHRSIKNCIRAECAVIVSLVPDEVWAMIMDLCMRRKKKVAVICGLCCLNKRWQQRASTYIRLNFADRMGHDKRVLSKFPELAQLRLKYEEGRRRIGNRALAQMTNLTSLRLGHGTGIDDTGIVPLKCLSSFRISGHCHITARVLATKTTLTHLALRNNKTIAGSVLKGMRNLTSLDLSRSAKPVNKDLHVLQNIQCLNLTSNDTIEDAGIMHMRTLRTLDLTRNTRITDATLRLLTNLTELNLTSNGKITDRGLQTLTGLQRLWLMDNNNIHTLTVGSMSHLRHLCLKGNRTVANWTLQRLTNLESLVLGKHTFITDADLEHLVGLRKLDFHDDNTAVTVDSLRLLTNLQSIVCYDDDAGTGTGSPVTQALLDEAGVTASFVKSGWHGPNFKKEWLTY